MKKGYYLKTCSTCQRILKEINGADNFKDLQNIKVDKITVEQLEEMKALSGSYEALFSRKSMQYRALGLKDKVLTEKDYQDLILKEYTFLKRPVFIVDDEIFIGNAKETVEALKTRLND